VFLGALLLTVAELTTLYTVHVATSHAALKSEGTGSHNGYAMIPVAALALLLAAGVWHRNGRLALLAIAALGVLALILALVHDLPDAQARGLLLIAGNYHAAKASSSAGLYMETLGAVVLIITGISGLVLAGPASPGRRPERPRRTHPEG
jgi:hypothetical protein